MVSVTKLIDLLNKPALVGWANKLGLKGIDLKDYQSKSKESGNIGHKQVEDYLIKGVKFNGSEKLDKTLKGFNVVGCEVSVDNGFIKGRIDLIIEKNNIKYVCDFKSNKYIYIGTKLQLSAYKHIYNADKIAFINLEDLSLKEIEIDTDYYFEIIKRLYQIHELLIKTNEKL